MSKETENNLFMVSSMPRLYQHLLSGVASYEALGKRILRQIKTAHAFRRVEQVRELATILCNIPIREYQLIGQYYLVWCNCRESVFKAEALENLIGQTRTYKAQVLSSRAGIEVYQGNLEAALYFYSEALRTSPAISEYISVRLGIAAVKGIEGFHQSALKDIESLIPVIRYAESRLFFNLTRSCKSCSWASNCELSWINSSRLAFSRSIITHEVYIACQSPNSFAAWNSEQLPFQSGFLNRTCLSSW